MSIRGRIQVSPHPNEIESHPLPPLKKVFHNSFKPSLLEIRALKPFEYNLENFLLPSLNNLLLTDYLRKQNRTFIKNYFSSFQKKLFFDLSISWRKLSFDLYVVKAISDIYIYSIKQKLKIKS